MAKPRLKQVQGDLASVKRGWRGPGVRCAAAGLAVAEVLEPADELAVQGLGADEVAVDLPLRRVDEDRLGLPAADAAVAADQLLERRDLEGVGVEQGVEVEVRGVREGRGPQEVGGRPLRLVAEQRERVGAVDLAGRQDAHAVAPHRHDAVERRTSRPGRTRRGAWPARKPAPATCASMCSIVSRPGSRANHTRPEVAGAGDDQLRAAPRPPCRRPRADRATPRRPPAGRRRSPRATEAEKPDCRLRSDKKMLSGPQSSSLPVAAATPSAPPIRSWTVSSSDLPYRCRKVAPWLWPWSDSTTKWYGARRLRRDLLEHAR